MLSRFINEMERHHEPSAQLDRMLKAFLDDRARLPGAEQLFRARNAGLHAATGHSGLAAMPALPLIARESAILGMPKTNFT
jgi:hypothetical protein